MLTLRGMLTRRALLSAAPAVGAAVAIGPLAGRASAADLARLGAAFPAKEYLPAVVTGLDFYRYFFQPGKMRNPQTWAGQEGLVKAHDRYGCRSYSISFKPDGTSGVAFSAASVANINRFLDSVPDDVDPADVCLTYFHEHDGDLRKGTLTRRNYRSGSQQVASAAHAHGMKYGPIHNGVVYDPGRSPRWGLYANIWAQNEADLSLYDFWGVDCYSDKYENPVWMNPVKTYADSLGLPLLIGELAAPNADPVRQATWAAQARVWALANTTWAAWWSSQVGGSSVNYRLTDAAAAAWFGLS